jgi:SH3 domain
MGNVRAIKAHEIPTRAPLRVGRGEAVTIGERDTTWPAFVFVTAAGGEGWVPVRHLDAESGSTTVLEPYDTTELPTEQGEILTVVTRDDESGWLWLRDRAGRQGWVPADTIEELA